MKNYLSICMILLFISGNIFAQTLYEHYEPTMNSYRAIDGSVKTGQQFTIGNTGDNVTFVLDSIALRADRWGSPGTCHIYLQLPDGSGYPSGDTLAEGSWNGNDAPTDFGEGDTVYIDMGSTYTVSTSTQYVFHCEAPDGSYGNELNIARRYSDPSYTGGYEVKYEGGWAQITDGDLWFQVWGHIAPAGGGDTLWVDPVSGSDANDGDSYADRIKTLGKLSSIITDDIDVVLLFDTIHNGVLYLNDIDGEYGDPIEFKVYNEYGAKCKIRYRYQLSTWNELVFDDWSKYDLNIPGSLTKTFYMDEETRSGYKSFVDLYINGVRQHIAREPNGDNVFYRMTARDEGAYGYWFEDNVNTGWPNDYWNDGIACMYIDFMKKSNITDYSNSNYRFSINAPLETGLCTWDDCSYGLPHYFIINSENALDEDGEYKQDYASHIMYVHYSGDLNGQVVQITLQDSILGMTGCSYIRFSGITFQNGNKFTAWIDDSHNITFDSCKFQDAPLAAVAMNLVDSIYFNCDTIMNTNGSGVVSSEGAEIYFDRCYFYNIGVRTGHSGNYDSFFRGQGITIIRDDGFHSITRCRFKNLGEGGILIDEIPEATSYGCEIAYNLFENTNEYCADCGAVYIYYNQDDQTKRIHNNIIYQTGLDNTIQYDTEAQTRGIYLDQDAKYYLVDSNTVYNSQQSYFINVDASYNLLEYNKSYYNTNNTTYSWASMFHFRYDGQYDTLRYNVGVLDNHDLDSSLVMYYIYSGSSFSTTGSLMDYNTYFTPYADIDVIVDANVGSPVWHEYFTQSAWITESGGWETNSTLTQTQYDTTLIYMNWSNTSHQFDFNATNAVDEAGSTITGGSISVEPYYSAIVRMNGFSSSEAILYTGTESQYQESTVITKRSGKTGIKATRGKSLDFKIYR